MAAADLRISAHALARWCERVRTGTDAETSSAIRRMAKHGRRTEKRPRWLSGVATSGRTIFITWQAHEPGVALVVQGGVVATVVTREGGTLHETIHEDLGQKWKRRRTRNSRRRPVS